MNYTVYFIKDGKKLKWKTEAKNKTEASMFARFKFGIILILDVKEENTFGFLKNIFGI